jgi:hypothetical protein
VGFEVTEALQEAKPLRALEIDYLRLKTKREAVSSMRIAELSLMRTTTKMTVFRRATAPNVH